MSENSDAYVGFLVGVFAEVTMIIETTQQQLEAVTAERDAALQRVAELEARNDELEDQRWNPNHGSVHPNA